MNRILVTGASGNTGRHVVTQLLEAGEDVRALSRDPAAANLPRGVEVVAGDLSDPASLDAALSDIDSVFLVWTAPPESVSAVIARIARRARRVVFLSSPYAHPHPMFQAAQPNPISAMHADIERCIKASELSWTFLRPGMLASNARGWWAEQIRKGDVVRWVYGDARSAPVDERDIAAIAVRGLRDDAPVNCEYWITGPQALTHRTQIDVIGETLGRRLRFEEMSVEDWRRERADFPPPIAAMLLKAWEASIAPEPLITTAIADVTERAPRTLTDFIRDNAADFLQAAPD